MPLIHGIRSTNIWRAFLLNSIVSTLVIFIAVTVKGKYDKLTDKDDNIIYRRSNYKSTILTLLVPFMASMAAYTFMYIMFGFGGGMLVNQQ